MNYDNQLGYIVVRDYLPSFAIHQFKLWALNLNQYIVFLVSIIINEEMVQKQFSDVNIPF